MGIFFRDENDNDDDEYTGQTGDPLHDAIYGWDMGSSSSSNDSYYHNSRSSEPLSRGEYYYREGKACSIKGDHLTAIKFYKEALKTMKIPQFYVVIADEYETIWDYENALYYWDELCTQYKNHRNLTLKGDFLYRIWRKDDAIAAYKEALTLLESKVGTYAGVTSGLFNCN